MNSLFLMAKQFPTSLWALLGGLIVAVIVLGLIIMKVRSSMLAKHSEASQEGLLEGLRRMWDTGEISRDEYDAARKNMVARMAGMKAPPRPPAPGEVRSPPGVDLTGRPLPRPDQPSQEGG